ncbi:MAG: hypothetical protein ABL958_04880 [Bdellovibrionia bacterium]
MKTILMTALLLIQGFNAHAIALPEGSVRPQESARLTIQNAAGFYSNVAAARLTRVTYEMTRRQGFVIDLQYRGQAQTQIEFIVKNIQRGPCSEVIYTGEMHIPYIHFTQGKPVIIVRDNRTNRCPTLIALPTWQVTVQNGVQAQDFINLAGDPDPIFTPMAVANRY